MKEPRVVAVVWPGGLPFHVFLQALMSAFAMSKTETIALAVEEDVNALSNSQALKEAIACFEREPDLRFVFGRDPRFFFASSVGAFELSIICRGNPPASVRDLINACRRFYTNKEGRMFVQLPIRFGTSLNSLRSPMTRARFEKERRDSDELHAIVDRVSREDPRKVERLLRLLGEAALREDRADDVEWQLAWVIEALEDDRLGQ